MNGLIKLKEKQMSFWQSNMGSITGNPEDAFTRGFTNIPDGTKLKAKIQSFEIVDGQYNRYLEVTWKVIGTKFDGQLVRQKIKCWDDDENKRFKALNMFMWLHSLFNLQAADREPHRGDLMRFLNKIAGLKVQLTKPTEEGKRYNWVSEVHKAEGFEEHVPAPEVEEVVTVKPQTPPTAPSDPYDDVPF